MIPFGFILFFVPALSAQQCASFSREIRPIHSNFGGVDGFYRLSKSMSDGLQKTPDEQTYQSLHQLIEGKESSGAVVKSLLLRQIGVLVFWSIGILLILAAVGLCIGSCIWSCVSTCAPKDGAVRKKRNGYIYLGLVLTFFVTLLTGVILFNLAQADLFGSIDHMVDYTDEISTDFNGMIGTNKDQLTCELRATTQTTFATVRDVINTYVPVVVDGTSEQAGLTAVNKFDFDGFVAQNDQTQTSADDLANQIKPLIASMSLTSACSEEIIAMHVQYEALGRILKGLSDSVSGLKSNPDLKDLNDQIVEIKKEIEEEAKKASDSITAAENSIDDSIGSIRNMTERLQMTITEQMKQLKASHGEFVSSSSYTTLKFSILLGLTVPACIAALLAVFALVAICLSLKKPDGLALKMAPCVFTAFNTVVNSSIVLILCACLTFIVGWVFSTLCLPIFEDPDYHLFHLMNHEIESTDPNEPPTVVNVGSFFETCSSPETTIYTAINGTNIISDSSIAKHLNVDAFRKQATDRITSQRERDFQLDSEWERQKNELKEFYESAKGMNLQSCADLNVNDLHTKYMKNLESSVHFANVFFENLVRLNENAPKVKGIAAALNDAQFGTADADVKKATSELMRKLKNDVFKCRPFVDIFHKVGHVLCDQFGKPVHGLWTAAGLTAISVFSLSLLFLFTFKWLKKSNETSKSGSKEQLLTVGVSGKKLGEKKTSEEKLSGEKTPEDVKSTEKTPEAEVPAAGSRSSEADGKPSDDSKTNPEQPAS